MRDHVLALYHWLPAPARTVAATLRGSYLRRWRYGPASEHLVQHALERDRWNALEWNAWREERLAYVLTRAATRVPYYRTLWSRRRQLGDRRSPELLEHWPVLEKEEVRRDPHAFVADDCDVRRMYHERTSGTTGKPLDVWRSRSTVEQHFALVRARTRLWFRVPASARYARLGGQLVTPVRQRRPPFWVWNSAMGQLYMSSWHLAPDLLPFYLDAIKRYRISHIVGYSSSVVAVAHQAVRSGREDCRMLLASTNAEPLFDDQRAVIAQAFQCPVCETYGMAEGVAAASECEHRRLHLWPELGHVEVWEDGLPLPSGETGDLLCTSLLNADMPLIRYRVGDRGRLLPETVSCDCGRGLPIIDSIEGRSDDLVFTADGRRLARFTAVFYGLPVRYSQVVQEALDRVTIRVVPAPGFGEHAEETIHSRLRFRLNDVSVRIERLDEIPRTASGKLQAVVCRLPAEERAAALRRSPANRVVAGR
jgi:phenylacetate-CoA ligase